MRTCGDRSASLSWRLKRVEWSAHTSQTSTCRGLDAIIQPEITSKWARAKERSPVLSFDPCISAFPLSWVNCMLQYFATMLPSVSIHVVHAPGGMCSRQTDTFSPAFHANLYLSPVRGLFSLCLALQNSTDTLEKCVWFILLVAKSSLPIIKFYKTRTRSFFLSATKFWFAFLSSLWTPPKSVPTPEDGQGKTSQCPISRF